MKKNYSSSGGLPAIPENLQEVSGTPRSTPAASRQLTHSIETAGAPLYLMYDQFWAHERGGELVLPFLVLLHQIVRASVPLMEAGAEAAAARAETDAVCAPLAEYLKRHVDEEANHDVWLMDDLVSAGMSEAEVWNIAPSTSVAAMAGAQYYWIHHHHPIALLGYIRLLEGSPPSVEHIERLKQKSGLPDSAFRCYRMHGELDPDHLREFDDMFDALPLSPDHLQLVQDSAVFTAHMLANCLGEIMLECESRSPPGNAPRASASHG